MKIAAVLFGGLLACSGFPRVVVLHDPLTRILAQIIVIIAAARLLGLVVSRLRQPMVIAVDAVKAFEGLESTARCTAVDGCRVALASDAGPDDYPLGPALQSVGITTHYYLLNATPYGLTLILLIWSSSTRHALAGAPSELSISR